MFEGTDLEDLCKKGLYDRGEWRIIMRTVTSSKQLPMLIEKLREHYNLFEIMNRNMPFMARKIENKKVKVNEYRGVL